MFGFGCFLESLRASRRPLPGLRYRSTFVSRKLPSHVFASHHLRLAFAPLRACSALPCSCLEPSALGVRPALFSSRLQKPTSQVAHASPELRHRLFFWLRSEHAFGIFLHCLCPLQKKITKNLYLHNSNGTIFYAGVTNRAK